jgi:hypothetical protein
MFGSADFIRFGQEQIAKYFNGHRDVTDSQELKAEDVYNVWYCKSLQNHKGLFSTPVSDGIYYEITYNGDTNEAYIDVYKKWENVVVKEVVAR